MRRGFQIRAGRNFQAGVWKQTILGTINVSASDIRYVYLKMRTKYARLCWDCISVSPREDRHARDERGELVRAMYKKFCTSVGPAAAGKPLFFGSAFAGSIDKSDADRS